MKTLFVLLILLAITGTAAAQSPKKTSSGVRVYTLPAGKGAMISLDSAVTSFEVTFISNSIVCGTRKVFGNRYYFDLPMKAGSYVLVENILAADANGNTVRRPSIKYVYQ